MITTLSARTPRQQRSLVVIACLTLWLSGCEQATTEAPPGVTETAEATPLASCCSNSPSKVTTALRTDLLAPEKRPQLNLAHMVTRQDGVSESLTELLGKPALISFIYTTCTNPLKCERVTRRMAELQTKMEVAGLRQKAKLLLITYDPGQDTPEVLRAYAGRFHLVPDANMALLRPEVDSKQAIYKDLNVPASFNAGGVTMHSIQMLVLDKAGRLARTYTTLIWDNDQVIEDLRILLDEQ